MSEMLAIPARRAISPAIALLFALSLVAAVALGFALRAWTGDGTTRPGTPAVVVQHAPSTAQDICRMGRPC